MLETADPAPVRPLADDGARPTGGDRSTADAAPAERRPLRRRLRLPFAVGALVQVVLVAGDRLPSVDAMAYFATGRNVLAGNGYVRNGAPELHFPPVAPVALGVLERLTGSDLAAVRTWNLLWGLATVAALTLLAWFLSRDDDVTVAGAWLATAVPGTVALAVVSGNGTELPSTCFVVGAAIVALHAIDPDRTVTPRARSWQVAAAGALVGLAYLTRPDALLPGLVVGAAVVLAALRDRALPRRGRLVVAARHGAAFGLACAVFVAPYVAHTHHHTGSWSLTSKSRDASIEAWRAVAADDRLARDRVLYEIQPDGTTLGPETRSLVALAREDPAGWLDIVGVNASRLRGLALEATWVDHAPTWALLPVFLLVPAAWQLWATRRRRATAVLAAVAAVPVATCLAFFTLPRYLILTTAVLVPFAAWGLVELLRRLPRPARTAAVVLVALGTVASLRAEALPLLPGAELPERTEQRTAGRWLAANTPADARIMTRSFHVQGYSERDVVAMPSATYPELLAYARRLGVDYVVADESTMRNRRPELFDALVRAEQAPDGLVLVHEFTQADKVVRIFALDPPAPPTDLPPRPLGYVSD